MERFVEVAGCRLFVRDEGAGPPIVLLHAAIAEHTSWDAIVPGLLDAGYRVVRYDLRGFGRSPTEDVEYGAVDDLIAVLDDAGIERAALVGNSFGGQTSFEAAIVHPERVVAVVGVGASVSGYQPDVTPAELAIFEEGDRLFAEKPRNVAAVADLLVRVWVNGPGQPDDRVDRSVREMVRETCLYLYEPAHVEGHATALEPPAAERLGELRCPVLAVAGDLDLSDIAATARHLESSAPNARAVILPGVAHMVGMEAPETLARLILEFLDPLRPW